MTDYNALLLDFEPAYAERLDATLSGAGVHLKRAPKPNLGLEFARKQPIQLLIADLDRSPRPSIRLLCDLNKLGQFPKMLWITSTVTEAGIKRVLASGAHGLLSRTADTVATISAVRTILAGDNYFPAVHSAAPSSGERAVQESARILRLLHPDCSIKVIEAS